MSFKNWLRNNFVAGVLVVVPLLGTLALFWVLFAKVTGPGYEWLLGRFRSETAGAVMVPKKDSYFFQQERTLEEVRYQVLRSGYSYFAVYRDDLDDIVGIFSRTDLLKYSGEQLTEMKIKDVMTNYRVLETRGIGELLEEFRQNDREVASVVDKRGAVVGIVRIEDLAARSFVFRQILEENEVLFRLIVLFLTLGLIVIIGLLARNFLGRRVILIGEILLERIPIVSRVYIAFKQISQAFWGRNKTVFSHVVLLEYPRRGLYTLGFVTSPGRGEVDAKTKERLINVFLPTTPNPTSGWFVMVPENQAVRMEMKVEDALKMIISGGAVVPEYRTAVKVLEERHNDEEDEGQAETESEFATPQSS